MNDFGNHSAEELLERPPAHETRAECVLDVAQALRESEQRLQVVLDAARMGIWEWTIATGAVSWSPGLERIHGRRPGSFDGTIEGMLVGVHPEDRERLIAAARQSAATRSDLLMEYRITTESGEQRWIEARGRLLCDAAGTPERLTGICLDITQRKAAEQAVRDSQERFIRFMQYLPGLAWIKEADGRYIFVNDAAERAFRKSRAELYGRTDDEIFSPEVADVFRANDQRALTTGTGIEAIETLEHDDGVHHSIVSKFPIPGGNGAQPLIGGMAIDITERVQTEDALRESETRFRTLADNAPVAIFIKDLDGRYTLANPLACRELGRPDGVIGLTDADLLPRDVAEKLRAHDREVIAAGRPVEYEEVVQHGADSRRFLSAKFPLRDALGKPVGVCGVAVDITERKRAVEALQQVNEQLEERVRARTAELAQANAKFQAMFDQGPFAGLLTLEGILIDANRSSLESCGFAPEQVIGKPYWDTGWWNRSPAVQAWLRAGFAQATRGDVFHGESIYFFADGAEHIIDFALIPIRDDRGDPLFIVATGMDITDRRRAEQEHNAAEVLRESEARFRQLADHAPALIWVNGIDGCEFVNRQYLEFVGCTLEQVRGSGWLRFVHPEDAEVYVDLYGRAFVRREPFEAPVRFRRADGEYRWLRSSGVPRFDADGTFLGYVGCSVDITDIKRSEEAAREAQESAEAANQTKDRFLAILSHELRTPLTPVLIAASSMEKNARLPAEVREHASMIRDNIRLETKLIDDLLDLNRITSEKLRLQLEPVDLNDAVLHVCGICHAQLQEKAIRLHCAFDEHVGYVNADPARLQQVLWNILQNAAKFTPRGGDIWVTTQCDRGQRYRVEVRDTGIGIAPDMTTRIFDAFEQGDSRVTRQYGGLGLGLAISRALIELQDGTIRAESDGAGRGATFTVELPAAPPAPKDARAGAAPDRSAREPQLHLLLVEDHLDTARVLSRMLRASGHLVMTAATASEALDLAARETFDLVVSDVGLPDASGYELMQRLRQVRPLKGIAMSGYGMDDDIRRSREAGFSDHLVKPVELNQLEQAIRRVVHSTP